MICVRLSAKTFKPLADEMNDIDHGSSAMF